mgnify:CR=1 FL=1
MGKIIVFIFISFTISTYAQTNKFKEQVTIVNSFKADFYSFPKSIIFVFNDSGHLGGYCTKLFKDLKKTLRKEKIKVGSEFNFSNKKDFANDISNAPKNKNKRSDFEYICNITTEHYKDPEEWKNYKDLKKRKTQHDLIFTMYNNKYERVLKLKLFIQSYYTIATKTKETSILFYEYIR